jgi:hypothetical protein
MRKIAPPLAWVGLLAAGCPDPVDTPPARDAAALADAAIGVDTRAGNDAATAGDAGAATDASGRDQTAPPDAVTADSGADASHADGAAVDAASPDVGQAGEDAGLPPQGDNLIANGSFELWDQGLPVGWYGSESNLDSASVVEDTSAAHDGVRACQLINEGTTHRRFTTQPMSLPAGRYHCSAWVRGAGEIRTARYDGDYSSYSSYTVVDGDGWSPLRDDFSLAQPVVDVFQLVFSVRSTNAARGHLHLDDVRCTRDVEACDSIACESWQRCDNAVPGCVTASGFCGGEDECLEWQDCGLDHLCATAAGRCAETADCGGGATPVCDLGTHTCVAGDPCAGVVCDEWKQCNPADSSCVLGPDRCVTTADCLGSLPACDVSTHACVAVDSAVNIVPNGGFEDWEEVWLGGPSTTTYHLPVSWYGVCDGCSPYFPTTEIAAGNVRAYTASAHGGSTACQLIRTTIPGHRFTTEPFAVSVGTTYSCAYRVRGKGTHRQRAYCGAWAPDTDYLSVDSDAWQAVPFELRSSTAAWCVLIFYASNTDAARDHVQLDDVVCTRKLP